MPDLTTNDALLERMATATENLATDVPAKFDKYLPLSGGTMTGVLNLVAPDINSNDEQAVTTKWVNDKFAFVENDGSHTFTGTDYEEVATVDIPANTFFSITYRENYTNSKPNGAVITHSTVANAVAFMENQTGNISSATYCGYETSSVTLHFLGRHSGAGDNSHSIRGIIIKVVP